MKIESYQDNNTMAINTHVQVLPEDVLGSSEFWRELVSKVSTAIAEESYGGYFTEEIKNKAYEAIDEIQEYLNK